MRKESKSYQKELWLLLPPKIDIPEGRLEITFHFGMSMASDYDNPIKIFQDVLVISNLPSGISIFGGNNSHSSF
jgi:hypothetical protein